MSARPIKEGAGGKVFPLGRWNRDQGCHPDVIHERAGREDVAWFQCSCGAQGPMRHGPDANREADQDADSHERAVFARRSSGKRWVRGAWE